MGDPNIEGGFCGVNEAGFCIALEPLGAAVKPPLGSVCGVPKFCGVDPIGGTVPWPLMAYGSNAPGKFVVRLLVPPAKIFGFCWMGVRLVCGTAAVGVPLSVGFPAVPALGVKDICALDGTQVNANSRPVIKATGLNAVG